MLHINKLQYIFNLSYEWKKLISSPIVENFFRVVKIFSSRVGLHQGGHQWKDVITQKMVTDA